ncbi:GDH/6PGL endoplasmic bifunctional protein [Syngnathoides biaculeatus]|uniref:GDH/6PGL endoplasmic bifunctional protein n=1 Tax=Syngnathoides biaculeatus TaxID=300417 RepID=UPI002ADD3442|nr:GDH/6PGL endoplasmic bifunctional protein [Syngnathoides biaculeatus]XP_061688121.1 GDH/6PGL endoplasmic bifunctional protein [Syngnathoides biaculeatus]XP_061688122.1 GDH/6PGL endoplasmic bifunctional protein [Syngnathoides biaculeatus]XP_061688123.1 GDH/6PGL endoplasmic bifunctional protein [Syngnathoides biaculeatus]XP_061688124.1 GDH/6PGL endoplasmic bifunctional protein [Syngnathoides biaculeatus]XP_061688126.1 GDH/6PGL endoplasmic bifunctional protein [Syngnathoides biaculeatus]XP_06
MYATTLLLSLALFAVGGHGEEKQSRGHVSVVVVGGTGDLAKKYLWQGFFQLYSKQVSSGHTFSFYASGQSHPDKATPIFFGILKAVSCPEDVSEERCAVLKEQFLRLSQYRQLKTLDDYQNLAQHIERQVQDEGLTEAGRLFYLCVPAFAYADIADKINNSCRPAGEAAWLRVVLEKPFGHDLRSAQVLAAQLGKAFCDKEMYRIDHYLGKQVVSKILPFRVENKKFLDPIWNKHHIERIEIVLKETLDVQGRIPFYDEYGVIRDVIQNHLTEVMALLTMRLPANLSDSEEVLQNKLRLLTSFLPLGKNQAVVGQYQAYQAEVQQELNKTKDHVSITPTFAAVLAHMDAAQYNGVPILLISGKMLDERVGYARVLFKSDMFCLQDGFRCKPKQIVFYFGHGSLQYPAVLVSKNLFKPSVTEAEWKEVMDHANVNVLGSPLSDYYVQTPRVQREAYGELISHIFAGRKNSFISTENLLASWDLWTPLLESLAITFPRIYPGGADNGDLLDVRLKGKEIAYESEVVLVGPEQAGGAAARNLLVMQGKYRSADMVSAWAEELVERLAADIQEAAEAAVLHGGVFHLALSGGATPIALFHRLALHHFSFPWSNTHIWMADERCVPLADPQSNFHSVHQHVLQHVRIPYYNIHPMPVQLKQRLCVEDDGATLLYQEDIGRLVNGSRFHFVLLGVGHDGHTASLFPGGKTTEGDDGLAVLTESPVKPHRRMSLTFGAINRAHRVALLVMGKTKHELVTQLSRVKGESGKWPVTRVKPTNGTLSWYIDYDALLG